MKKAAQRTAFVCTMQTPERSLFQFHFSRNQHEVKLIVMFESKYLLTQLSVTR